MGKPVLTGRVVNFMMCLIRIIFTFAVRLSVLVVVDLNLLVMCRIRVGGSQRGWWVRGKEKRPAQ